MARKEHAEAAGEEGNFTAADGVALQAKACLVLPTPHPPQVLKTTAREWGRTGVLWEYKVLQQALVARVIQLRKERGVFALHVIQRGCGELGRAVAVAREKWALV